MAYCSPSDVAALNKARVIGQGQNPTASDVGLYINMTAGEIDAILVDKGYMVPVPSASTEAWALLNKINAEGGFALMEEASPNSTHADRARASYEKSKAALASSRQVMDAPKNTARAGVRAPWVTYQPDGRVYDPFLDEFNQSAGNTPARPYLSRQQQF